VYQRRFRKIHTSVEDQDSFPREGTDFILCFYTLTSCGLHPNSIIVEAVHRGNEMKYECDPWHP
jgi:hypothetical protein